MDNYLGVCVVRGGSEREAQADIERAGFGTRVPAFRMAYDRQGRRQVQIRPLFAGYVFTYLEPGYGALDEIDGVTVLKISGAPMRITGKDEERLAELERHCLLGDFNRVKYRSPDGRFAKKQFIQKKRRRRPRPGKRLRDFTRLANHQTTCV